MRRTLVRAARLWEGSVLGARVSAVNRGHSENIPGSGDMRGVVLRPSSWQDLQQKIEENTVESLGALGRTAVDIEVYREFRRQVWTSPPPGSPIVLLLLLCSDLDACMRVPVALEGAKLVGRASARC